MPIALGFFVSGVHEGVHGSVHPRRKRYYGEFYTRGSLDVLFLGGFIPPTWLYVTEVVLWSIEVENLERTGEL